MGRRERSGRKGRSECGHERRRPRRLRPLRPLRPLWLLLPTLGSCELTEVTVAPGTPVVVVQSVISRTAREQFVVVEYSQAGDGQGTFGDVPIPPGNPRRPIRGALVTIMHGDGACAGRVDTLLERPPRDATFVTASGTYAGPICPPAPGEQVVLRVETPAGEEVTGATTVPGASARDISTGGDAPGPAGTSLLNRALDTLVIGLTPISGTALQIEVRNAADREDLSFFGFTDTMSIRLPGNLVNPFEGDDGESIFRAGRYYTLSVALTDSNYYDFLRSHSDPFTGRGFINRLTGGLGVFGSVETQTYRLGVVAPVDDPFEGVYRLTGTVDTVSVDVTLELYLDDLEPALFSAFVRGAWREGPIDLSADGVVDPDRSGEMFFHFLVPGVDSLSPASYGFGGVRSVGGASFPVTVQWSNRDTPAIVTDTLTARQISGPGLGSASTRR